MPRGFLNVFKLSAIFKRRGDQGCSTLLDGLK
jgi:hypothetical protein